MRFWLPLVAALFVLGGRAAAAEPLVVEQAVARFWAPDTGGVRSPHFIYARVLCFEARLEAELDASHRNESEPFRERHLNAALERHVGETLLAGLHIDPEPSEAELKRQILAARARLSERLGGEAVLFAAAAAEGIGERDLLELFRREARASLYLDRMVAPMLNPSSAELRSLHATRSNPFRDAPFERIEPALRRWYVAQRLASAVQNFYQNARSRITLTLLADVPGLHFE